MPMMDFAPRRGTLWRSIAHHLPRCRLRRALASRQRLTEIGRERDEIADGNRAIVIYNPLLPSAALSKLTGEVDEVSYADGLIEVQIANQRSGGDDGVLIHRLPRDGAVSVI